MTIHREYPIEKYPNSSSDPAFYSLMKNLSIIFDKNQLPLKKGWMREQEIFRVKQSIKLYTRVQLACTWSGTAADWLAKE